MCLLPVFSDGLHALAAEHERARSVKKCLRFPPHSTIAGGGGNMNLPEWDAYVVSHTTVEVSKGIRPEVNGIYNFVAFKQNAGYYSRLGSYDGNPALFTLYKCTVNNGGYQWFISVTPEGLEPGTNRDVDFYFSHAKSEFYGNHLPPKTFGPLNPQVDKQPGLYLPSYIPFAHSNAPSHPPSHPLSPTLSPLSPTLSPLSPPLRSHGYVSHPY